MPHHASQKGFNQATSRKLWVFCWLTAAGVTLLLAVANLFLGELNQDEGWYLYAAQLVSEGKLPYLHFAYTQGPAMPFVYALGHPLVSRWGVAGGRVLTLLLGFAACASAAALAARLVRPREKMAAAFLTFTLIGVNVYQSYFCTIVKTYSLTALLILLGLLVLTRASGRKAAWTAAGAGVLLGLAAATRTSAAFMLPVVFLALVRSAQHETGAGPAVSGAGSAHLPGPGRLGWLWFGLGATGTLGAAFLPFAFSAPQGLWFALAEYHAGRDPGGLARLLGYKAGFISRVAQDYMAALTLCLVWCVLLIVRRTAARGGHSSLARERSAVAFERLFVWMLWGCIVTVTLVHLSAPFPYDDYQVFLFPILAVAVAVSLIRYCRTEWQRWGLVLSTLGLCLATAFSSPINHQWFVAGQDRIWWPLRETTPLAKLQDAGDALRAMTHSGEVLLTQDPYLAVEAGLHVPAGLELGPFSYFPDWSTDEAAERRVMNREMLLALIRNGDTRVAAFSEWGLSIRSPGLTELSVVEQRVLRETLENHYQLIREVEDFGQAETKLQIFIRADGDDAAVLEGLPDVRTNRQATATGER